MISEKRKRIVLTVAILSIAMILANILHVGTFSFVPLETKDLSSDNLDEGTFYSTDTDEEVETIRTEGIIESPIYIDDTNPECDWEWASTQPWCSGSGIKDDPYVIKDLIIKRVSGSCISIKNSEAYFRIENCKLHHSETGITLKNTNNGEIINNDVSQGIIGIYLWNSDGYILRNNILVGNTLSIIIRDSSENSVNGNSFLDNHIGISIGGLSSDNTINYNSFYRSRGSDIYYI